MSQRFKHILKNAFVNMSSIILKHRSFAWNHLMNKILLLIIYDSEVSLIILDVKEFHYYYTISHTLLVRDKQYPRNSSESDDKLVTNLYEITLYC